MGVIGGCGTDATSGPAGQADGSGLADAMSGSDSEGAADGVSGDASGQDGLVGGADGLADASGDGHAPSRAALGITQVWPERLSARGGELFVLQGQGLQAGVHVWVGERRAEVVGVQKDGLEVRSPRYRAGHFDVRVVSGPDEAVASAALELTAITPIWNEFGTAEAVDAPVVRDAVPMDVDLDGDLDVLVATSDGLRVLISTFADAGRSGQGSLGNGPIQFKLLRDAPAPDEPGAVGPPTRVGGSSDVRALATGDLDADGHPDAIACTHGARELWIRPTAEGPDWSASTPVRAGSCTGVGVSDFDGDGADEIVVLLEGLASSAAGFDDVGLWAYRASAPAAEPPSLQIENALAPSALDPVPIGLVDSADPTAENGFTRMPDLAKQTGGFAVLAYDLHEGASEAEFTLPVTMELVPDRLRFRLKGGAGAVELIPRLKNAAGMVFEGPPLSVQPDQWTWAQATGVGSWLSLDSAGAPTSGPIVAVGLLVRAQGGVAAQGAVQTDDWTALLPGGAEIWIADFDERTSALSWPDATALAVGDGDLDGRADLVVLRAGEDAPTVLWSTGQAWPTSSPWSEAPLPPMVGAPFAHVAWLSRPDGRPSCLYFVAWQQDQLLVTDSSGALADVTATGLPLDWVVGRRVSAADVDLDGFDDAIIANASSTDRLYLSRADETGALWDSTPLFGFDELDTAVVAIADFDQNGVDDVLSFDVDGTRPALLRLGEEAP